MKKYFLKILWDIYRQRQDDCAGCFCRELSSDEVSMDRVWLDDITDIWKLEGRRLSWFIIGSRKKIEFIQLDDVTANYKLVGSRSSWIETDLRYKPSEVFQLPALLKICRSLWNICLKRDSWWVKVWMVVKTIFELDEASCLYMDNSTFGIKGPRLWNYVVHSWVNCGGFWFNHF